jgi:rubrerythrin
MAIRFEGSEIVDLGKEIEKNGEAFYDEAAKNAKSKNAKELFEILKEQEKCHIHIFEELGKGLDASAEPESFEGEYAEYMKNLASQNVFTRKNTGKEAAKKAKTDREIMDIAVNFEKESILLFEGMKKVVAEKDIKTIEGLIKEEQRHMNQLIEGKRVC